MRHIITDSHGFDAVANEGGLIVIVFGRTNAVTGLTGDAIERLMLLSDSPEYTSKFEGRVTFSFEGYDRDPREIQQIPECVRFFRETTSNWPYWFHFISKDEISMGLLFSLLCDFQLQTQSGGMSYFRLKDVGQVEDVMKKLFNGMNALHDLHGVSMADNERISDAVNDAIMRFLEAEPGRSSKPRPGQC